MSAIGLKLESQLRFHWFSEDVDDVIVLDEIEYARCFLGRDEAIFYDWVVDCTGTIRAIQLNMLSPSLEKEVTLDIHTLTYIDTGPLWHIWMTNERDGQVLGLEAFGDIAFYTKNNRWLLVVGTDIWITPTQRDQLKSIAGCA